MLNIIPRSIIPSAGWISNLLVITVLCLGCEDGDPDFVLGEAPVISLLSVSSDTISEFEEALILTIEYEDGDGDLGYEETDRFALFVRDVRLEEFDGFYLGPIAPPGSQVPIRGQIDVEFPDLFIFGNSDQEITRFEIKMIDRAMNVSNIIETENILILR